MPATLQDLPRGRRGEDERFATQTVRDTVRGDSVGLKNPRFADLLCGAC
jgi:hypothetical protein